MNSKGNQITYLTQLYANKIEQFNELKAAYENEKRKYDSLRQLIFSPNFHKMIAIETIDNLDYITYISNFIYDTKNELEFQFVMQPLYPNSTKSATADIEGSINCLHIVNLDASPFRAGHGSRLLKYIELYASANGIPSICGRVFESTPIGLSNLIHFYEKNGYIVKEKSKGIYFSKHLLPID